MHVSYQCKRCMAPVHQHWRHASLALFHQVDSKLLNADWMKTHLQEWVMSMQGTHGYTVYEKRMYVCLYWLWSTDYVQMCEILWNKYSFIHSYAIIDLDSTLGWVMACLLPCLLATQNNVDLPSIMLKVSNITISLKITLWKSKPHLAGINELMLFFRSWCCQMCSQRSLSLSGC